MKINNLEIRINQNYQTKINNFMNKNKNITKENTTNRIIILNRGKKSNIIIIQIIYKNLNKIDNGESFNKAKDSLMIILLLIRVEQN